MLSLELDPSKPYLSDHKVGGVPLFGNVIAIEAMVTAAATARTGGNLCISEIRGPRPCFIHTPRTVIAEAERIGNESVCRVFSWTDGTEEVYFTAKISRGKFHAPPSTAIHIFDASVSGEDIYKLYFHGPAFQVVKSAWMLDGVMYARLNKSIPPVFPKGRPLTAPRLIELCLQTSGLWQIAFSGKMLIPEVIGRIVIYKDVEEVSAELIAVARGGFDGMEILLCDLSGNVYVEVSGYKTVPLPAPVNEVAAENLRSRLIK